MIFDCTPSSSYAPLSLIAKMARTSHAQGTVFRLVFVGLPPEHCIITPPLINVAHVHAFICEILYVTAITYRGHAFPSDRPCCVIREQQYVFMKGMIRNQLYELYF